MRQSIFLIITLLIVNSFQLEAQPNFKIQNEQLLYEFAWCGGLDACQFGSIDLNNDFKNDLVVFDRRGNRLLCFLNQGSENEIHYVYAPELVKYFPEFSDWVIFVDFDKDNKVDIFTYSKGWAGIKVYKNITSQSLEFELVKYPYLTSAQSGNEVNILATNADYPAIVDIDDDGDLDILTFWALGTFIELHKNQSVERYGNVDSLCFEKVDYCWGRIAESEEDNTMFLDTCLFERNDYQYISDYRHRGATFGIRDLNGDNLPDLLLADVGYPGITMFTNGGTAENAIMVSQDTLFPQNEPVKLFSMPVPFFTDINNDGLNDMIVSPFDPTPLVTENKQSVWLYLNRGTNQIPEYQLFTKSFLQNQMLDFGSGAFPSFVDLNQDGLLDLIVGNIGELSSNHYIYGTLYGNNISKIQYFKNTGTEEEPIFKLIDSDLANLSQLETKGLTPAFADLLGDEKMEMLVGNSEGNMLLYSQNENQNWELVSDKYLDFQCDGWSAPNFFDVNGDAIVDLTIGQQNGRLTYYEGFLENGNIGFAWKTDFFGNVDVRDYSTSYYGYSIPYFFKTNDNELFLLVGSEKGEIFLFDEITNNLEGAFHQSSNLSQFVDNDFFKSSRGYRTSAAIADLNRDSKMELVIGNFSGGLELFNASIEVMPSVQGVDEQTVVVYPNPSNSRIVFNLSEIKENNVLVKVFTSSGLLVRETTKNCSEGQFILNISGLKNGLYFIEIQPVERKIVKKIIKN